VGLRGGAEAGGGTTKPSNSTEQWRWSVRALERPWSADRRARAAAVGRVPPSPLQAPVQRSVTCSARRSRIVLAPRATGLRELRS